MNGNFKKYKDDLEKLIELGTRMMLDLKLRHLLEQGNINEKEKKAAKKLNGTFEEQYQNFYTEAHSVIRQLIPERLSEFEILYKGEGRRKEVASTTYTIQDWLNGIRSTENSITRKKGFDDFAGISMRFKTQLAILIAVGTRFESTLHDIKQLVQADLFDSELSAAEELNNKGFLRGAGAIAGVVLEKHLAQVSENHSVKTKKKYPCISDYNDLLKKESVIDVPVWRQIQRLGDIRNLCDHNKDREPTAEEIQELISGVEKFTKTLF